MVPPHGRLQGAGDATVIVTEAVAEEFPELPLLTHEVPFHVPSDGSTVRVSELDTPLQVRVAVHCPELRDTGWELDASGCGRK